MIKVGLSGSRYSGKTFVCNDFKRLSIPIFEADIIMRYLIKYNEDVQKEYNKRLHDFSYVSKDFRKSKEGIEILIDSTKHELFKAYSRFQEKHNGDIYTIFHSSVLFEKDWHELMDFSINVFAPRYTRMDRALDLYKIKRGDTQNLISEEMDPIQKNKMANFVIHSYLGTGVDVRSQIAKIDDFIIKAYIKQSENKKILSI